MSRLIRASAVLAASAAVFASAPGLVHAEDTKGPVDEVTKGLVQIQTVVTGSIFVEFDVENSVKGWSDPLTFTAECTGVSVEEDRIVTSASCIDPNAYHIASTLRGQAAEQVLRRHGKPDGTLRLGNILGQGQDWKVVADPDHPNAPANVTTTVRRLGETDTTTATTESSSYGTSTVAGAIGMLRLTGELDGLEPLLFSDQTPTLGTRVFVAAPGSAGFNTPATAADLRSASIESLPKDDDGRVSAKIAGTIRPQEFGAPVVDESGTVVGLMSNYDSSTATEAAGLHRYLASKGVEFAVPSSDDDGPNLFVRIGIPVIVAVAVAAAVLVGVTEIRRRRRAATQAKAHAQFFASGLQPIPSQQFAAPQPAPIPPQQYTHPGYEQQPPSHQQVQPPQQWGPPPGV